MARKKKPISKKPAAAFPFAYPDEWAKYVTDSGTDQVVVSRVRMLAEMLSEYNLAMCMGWLITSGLSASQQEQVVHKIRRHYRNPGPLVNAWDQFRKQWQAWQGVVPISSFKITFDDSKPEFKVGDRCVVSHPGTELDCAVGTVASKNGPWCNLRMDGAEGMWSVRETDLRPYIADAPREGPPVWSPGDECYLEESLGFVEGIYTVKKCGPIDCIVQDENGKSISVPRRKMKTLAFMRMIKSVSAPQPAQADAPARQWKVGDDCMVDGIPHRVIRVMSSGFYVVRSLSSYISKMVAPSEMRSLANVEKRCMHIGDMSSVQYKADVYTNPSQPKADAPAGKPIPAWRLVPGDRCYIAGCEGVYTVKQCNADSLIVQNDGELRAVRYGSVRPYLPLSEPADDRIAECNSTKPEGGTQPVVPAAKSNAPKDATGSLVDYRDRVNASLVSGWEEQNRVLAASASNDALAINLRDIIGQVDREKFQYCRHMTVDQLVDALRDAVSRCRGMLNDVCGGVRKDPSWDLTCLICVISDMFLQSSNPKLVVDAADKATNAVLADMLQQPDQPEQPADGNPDRDELVLGLRKIAVHGIMGEAQAPADVQSARNPGYKDMSEKQLLVVLEESVRRCHAVLNSACPDMREDLPLFDKAVHVGKELGNAINAKATLENRIGGILEFTYIERLKP